MNRTRSAERDLSSPDSLFSEVSCDSPLITNELTAVETGVPEDVRNAPNDEDYDSEDEETRVPGVPWRQRIAAVPSVCWEWIKANRLKTFILLLVLAVIVFIIVEIVHGAVTQILTSVLKDVRMLGPWVCRRLCCSSHSSRVRSLSLASTLLSCHCSFPGLVLPSVLFAHVQLYSQRWCRVLVQAWFGLCDGHHWCQPGCISCLLSKPKVSICPSAEEG